MVSEEPFRFRTPLTVLAPDPALAGLLSDTIVFARLLPLLEMTLVVVVGAELPLIFEGAVDFSGGNDLRAVAVLCPVIEVEELDLVERVDAVEVDLLIMGLSFVGSMGGIAGRFCLTLAREAEDDSLG
jgi:hypothetical protein